MTRDRLKTLSILLFAAALVALLFFVAVPYEAKAETVENIYLYVGEEPNDTLSFSYGTYTYKVGTYQGRLNNEGPLVTLVDPDTKKVIAEKGKKYYADGSEVFVAYGENASSAPSYPGRVCFEIIVKTKNISLTLSASDLSKTYGESKKIVKETTQDDKTLIVTFTSAGLTASAPAREYNDLKTSSVTCGGEDVSDEYNVTPKMTVGDGLAAAIFTVNKMSVPLAYNANVPFNNFRSAGEGESIVSVEQAGANEETLTAYFRFKEEADRAKTWLTIGENYDIECYEYIVRDKDGQTVSSENYTVTGSGTLHAVSGPITLYQGEKAAYSGRADCVRLDLADFTYTYLDPFISSYESLLVFTGIRVYDALVDIRCSVESEEGAIPCGTYALTLLGVEQEGFDELTLDEDFSMVVTPYVLKYKGKDECQYGYGSFKKEVKVPVAADSEDVYTFSLSATIAKGLSVGDSVAYSEAPVFSKEDPNVALEYSEARVVIVKRSDGVAFRAADDLSAVYYRAPYTVCTLTLTEDGHTTVLSSDHVEFEYSRNGGETFTLGSPTVVGTYKIKCSVKDDSEYTTEAVIYDLTILPRPVLVVYKVASVTKKYGETFLFSSGTMNLESIHPYDTANGTADRSEDYRKANETLSIFSAISCAGAAASAEIGAYPIVVSQVSGNYDVKAILLKAGETESAQLTVVKSDAPPAVTLEPSYSGRAITLSASEGPALLQIAEKADFSDSSEILSQEGTASFSNRTYGKTYYVRACFADEAHYTKNGDWSEKSIAIPFPALTVELKADSVTDTQATFTARRLDNAVSYVVEHRVSATGAWKEGLTVEGLTPGVSQKVYFRAKAGSVVGQESSLSVKTLGAKVDKDAVSVSYDRETGSLTVTSSAELEMRLFSATGDLLLDWTTENVLKDIPRDSEYILQVRNAADGDLVEATSISIDTYRKGPFTFLAYLSDGFLIWIGVPELIALAVVVTLFVRSKKKIDSRLVGGKNEK